jgi:DNA repair exonuclease SbcCD ATPase subunit
MNVGQLFNQNLNEVRNFLNYKIPNPTGFDENFKQITEEQEKKRLKLIGNTIYRFNLSNHNNYLTKGLIRYNIPLFYLPNDTPINEMIKQFKNLYPKYDSEKDPQGFIKKMINHYEETQKTPKTEAEKAKIFEKKIEKLVEDIEKYLGNPENEEEIKLNKNRLKQLEKDLKKIEDKLKKKEQRIKKIDDIKEPTYRDTETKTKLSKEYGDLRDKAEAIIYESSNIEMVIENLEAAAVAETETDIEEVVETETGQETTQETTTSPENVLIPIEK